MNAVFGTLASAISSFAPALATALGGPLAGTAVTALESAFGLAPGSGVGEITKVIQTGSMTPETIAKVREADQKHAEAIAQNQIDVLKLNRDYVTSLAATDEKDRESARNRQVAVRDKTPAALAWLIILANVSLIGGISLGYVHPTDTTIATMVGTALGYLFAESKAVLAFYFGSSSGSQAKDATIDKALNSQ